MTRSTVLAAPDRFGIPQNRNVRSNPGQLPFGFDCHDYRPVSIKAEQGVIRLIGQYGAGGLSPRDFASQLNRRLVSTKNSGMWQANTMRPIPARA